MRLLSPLLLPVWVVGCGFSGNPATPPGDGRIDAPDGFDGGVDASPDAPDGYVADARVCFGSGFGALCLPAAPTNPRQLSDNPSFDTGGGDCSELVMIGSVETCVLSGTTVTLPASTTFRAIGTRPLVIVASETILIAGTLSVSSLRGTPAGAGAGAPSAACGAATAGEDDTGGGGGGAGGSFGGRGGNGGTGDTNSTFTGAGGIAAPAFVPASLRAGCPGTRGGNGTAAGGAAAPGGGAVYLTAGTSIEITGGLYAAGMGGNRGGVRGGGGGAGSGGLIGLDAPTVEVQGTAAANGGGGGEGGGFSSGGHGADGSPTTVRALGGAIEPDGGNGGHGSAGTELEGLNGGSSAGGGGGGGGGAGYIYVKGALSGDGTISPPASVTP